MNKYFDQKLKVFRMITANENRKFNSSFWELFSKIPWETVWKGNGKGKEIMQGCCSLRSVFQTWAQPSPQPMSHTGTTDRQGAPSSLQCKRQRRPQRATQEQALVGHIGRELGKSELSWIWNWWGMEMATRRIYRSRIKRRSKEDEGLWSKAADLKHTEKAEQPSIFSLVFHSVPIPPR